MQAKKFMFEGMDGAQFIANNVFDKVGSDTPTLGFSIDTLIASILTHSNEAEDAIQRIEYITHELNIMKNNLKNSTFPEAG
jgi:hypothetical protein